MFSEKLLDWYSENGRKLPWRETDNPYFIWLSEIILQQTRIEQGRSYYEHFITTYPTIRHLADASEEQVLKSWQGLGYYSRARNLHAAARQVAYTMDGRFPSTYEGILSLKGVGRYTAAAIASFAFRLPCPVIDGNVYRLVSRLYGITTPIGTDAAYRQFEELLAHLIDRQHPDRFNSAMMDFGSIYCKPTGCDCPGCIFRQECVAFRDGKVALLPVRPAPPKVQKRYFYYFDVRWPAPQGQIMLMQQRSTGDIWQGLFELPLHETAAPISARKLKAESAAVLQQWFGAEPETLEIGPLMKHQLTHRTIMAQFIRANYASRPPQIPANMRAVAPPELKTIPISRLIDRYLSKL